MTQIGDMFNDALKAKVAPSATRCRIWRHGAPGGRNGRTRPSFIAVGVCSPARWWPAGLGEPSSSGSQNSMSYAFFPEKRRLASTRNGKVMLYDTGEHRLSGFSQQQPGAGEVSFSGQNGPVRLESSRLSTALTGGAGAQ